MYKTTNIEGASPGVSDTHPFHCPPPCQGTEIPPGRTAWTTDSKNHFLSGGGNLLEQMEVSIVMGVPPVIIHFMFGYSVKQTTQLLDAVGVSPFCSIGCLMVEPPCILYHSHFRDPADYQMVILL